jgi:hypothetical protein
MAECAPMNRVLSSGAATTYPSPPGATVYEAVVTIPLSVAVILIRPSPARYPSLTRVAVPPLASVVSRMPVKNWAPPIGVRKTEQE